MYLCTWSRTPKSFQTCPIQAGECTSVAVVHASAGSCTTAHKVCSTWGTSCPTRWPIVFVSCRIEGWTRLRLENTLQSIAMSTGQPHGNGSWITAALVAAPATGMHVGQGIGRQCRIRRGASVMRVSCGTDALLEDCCGRALTQSTVVQTPGKWLECSWFTLLIDFMVHVLLPSFPSLSLGLPRAVSLAMR